ncbi:MAG: efflux RND transporter permease subunit [Bacteroidales bacterium]|nr:efflux RND transporter permease subunit [Bacteroidales bacterium]MBN2758336.1 efflux RND transporter permease subunit [Bacteroidales bacterium]
MTNAQTNSFKLSSFSIITIFVALMLLGMAFIPLLNIRLKPSRRLPQIIVSYNWYNASAKIIEQEVTSKLEGVFSTVKGIENINSISSKGNGKIEIEFKKHSNLEALRFEIATLIRISYPELPEQVSYPVISYENDKDKKQALLSYRLNANASPYFIQKYAKNNIVPKLALIKGVNEVNVFGANPYLWQIEYNSVLTEELELTADEIALSVNNYFGKEMVGIGNLQYKGQKNNNKIPVVLSNRIPSDINWDIIPLKKTDKRIIYLGDIANVKYIEQLPNTYFRVNGLNTINIVVYPEKDANNIKLAAKIRHVMSDIKKNLPNEYSVILAYDTSEDINSEIIKLSLRALFSLIILLIFVLVISRQFRYLLLIFISLLANLLIAFIFYYSLKLEIHLYSLAGITISFGIIIDNSIVMIHHYHHKGDKKSFISILAATLTTIGSLSIIFFLDKSQQINLIDFALVIIINLVVSLFTALSFIPALMSKIKLSKKNKKGIIKRKKMIIYITRFYSKNILFSKRFKWVYFIIFILGFGIPTNLLPDKIEKESSFAELYNSTFGSDWYKNELKEPLNKIIGGTFRLFTEYVFENSYYGDPQKTVLYLRGNMPEGCTVQQLNQALLKMENYLSKFDEIEMYQSAIYGYQNSLISIYFKPEYENGSFPYYLKELLTTKAINLGGLDWSISGVGKGFSNAISEGYRNNHIILEGYNYDRLYSFAEQLKSKLLLNNRIETVDIEGEISWESSTIHEYLLDFRLEKLALYNIPLNQLYQSLSNRVYHNQIGYIYNNNEMQVITLKANQSGEFDKWDLNNMPFYVNNKLVKTQVLSEIKKQKTGNNIFKFNQQYQLVVSYDFIGPDLLSKKVREKHIAEINNILPLGFKCKEQSYGWWNRDNKKQYYLLFIIILIIYFICSILFESLLQSLAIIAMIPISFIGVFLTFYLFDFSFDQGGFASFILLSGIVVNAGIYIINEFNQIKNNNNSLRNYLKAFNHKITPIFLTIISTILGLVPFIYSGQNDVFWFAFAAGSIGGLLFSFIAIIIYLPILLKLKNN